MAERNDEGGLAGLWRRLTDRVTQRGEEPAERLPSPSEIADELPPRRPGLEHGTEQAAAIEPETFVEREMRRRRESDQGSDADGDNERLKGRSLPDEQRERDKGRGR